MTPTAQSLADALGAALRARRAALGLRLRPAAASAGVSVSFLSQIELGQSSVSQFRLYQIARALNWTLSQLYAAVEASLTEDPQ